jgi:hypothetical protein
MLTRGAVGPNRVIKEGAAPLKVNAGLTVEEPLKYAKFVVRPDIAVASNVTVGVMSSAGGVGGGGVGGVGEDGGADATAGDPPPPPQPNSGAVMPTPSAIKTSRRFVLAAGAAEDTRSFEASFTLIDFTPGLLFVANISSYAKKNFERILANGDNDYCYVV